MFSALPFFHLRSQLIRSFLGAWITNRRTGQNPRPCIFGCCDSSDELQHYADCTPLLLAVAKFFNGFLHICPPLLCLDLPLPHPPLNLLVLRLPALLIIILDILTRCPWKSCSPLYEVEFRVTLIYLASIVFMLGLVILPLELITGLPPPMTVVDLR